MDEETFNLSIRKFLKVVGIGSQREIEQAVAQAIADGGIHGTERFPARNPAFDVTPAALVAAIVTERGIHRPPYAESLPREPPPPGVMTT